MYEEWDTVELDSINSPEYGRKKPKKKKKAWKIVLIIFLCLLLLVGGGIVGTFFYFYNRTNVETVPEVITIDEEKLKEMSLETIDPAILESILNEMTGSDWTFEDPDATWSETQPESKPEPTEPGDASSDADVTESEGESGSSDESAQESGGESDTEGGADEEPTTRDWEKEASEREATRKWSVETVTQPTYETVQPGQKSNVVNIMLIGVDETKAGNSDTMILLSINYTRHTITFTSFMRDIGITVPGVGFTRLNCAFAVGGGPLLVSTLRANFGIDVNYYAWVSLGAMSSIVEIIGGVDLVLTEAEAKYCGVPANKIDGTKVYHLDRYQAVMHCRDRSSGGNDYGRTQRQRDTLMAIINKVRSGSLGSVVNVINQCLPYVSHNVPAGTVAQLIANAPSIINYGINEQRVPYAGMYAGTNGYLVPNLSMTYQTWHTFVYGY